MNPSAQEDELLTAFREEAEDSLDALLRLRDGWAALSDGATRDRLLDAFRIFHNLKGGARLVGLAPLEPLAHAAEETLRGLHDADTRASVDVIDPLANAIRVMLGYAEGSTSADAVDALAIDLAASGPATNPLYKPVIDDTAGTPDGGRTPPSGAPPGEKYPEDVHSRAEPERAESGERRIHETVRVRVGQIDRLIGLTGELLTHHAHLLVKGSQLESFADDLREALRHLEGSSRDRIVASLRGVEQMLATERAEAQRFGLLTAEFGDTVRAVRMMPIANAVAGFRRIAEDAATELGKRVRFDADVGDISLDRRVLEGIRDPMMHLLRNAVDHGIESAPVRRALGKVDHGTLTLRARSVGAYVELSLSDDGGGIDRGSVVARAVEVGAIAPDRAAELTDDEAVDLIFSPGLSTAATVTRMSGRGIGLDVVRTRVAELGGRVDVASSAEGTTFRLTLPVDVVQTKGLLVRVGDGVLAVPMSHVRRTVRLPSSRLRKADGATIAAHADDEPLRLMWLAALLGVPRVADGETLLAVVVENAATEVGLVVDEVLGEAEFVVRPLPWNVVRVAGVVGAAVLGDGRLAIVLHLAALLSAAPTQGSSDAHAMRASESRSVRSVLVVDDSVTSRLIVRNILDAAGYETIVANDGEEAWEALQRRRFDLVVTDVQMPRLDGHGLTRRIRKDDRTARLPVIMVTSLARPEDVALGSEAGADEYIVKGRFDQRRLLEAVARLT